MKRILLVNDDGYDAPGFEYLKDFLTRKGEWVFSVAPEREVSCCSHSISFSKDMALKKLGDNDYVLAGTPVDCVIVGIELMKAVAVPNVVISGINNSQNIGREIYSSGTVAAAREAAFYGFKSIAISLDILDSHDDGSAASHYGEACRILGSILDGLDVMDWPADSFLNVNVPKAINCEISTTHLSKSSFLKRNVRISANEARVFVSGQNLSCAEIGDDIDALKNSKASVGFLKIHYSNNL